MHYEYVTSKSEDNISINNTGVSTPASENAVKVGSFPGEHTTSQVKGGTQNVYRKGLNTKCEFLLSDAGVNLSLLQVHVSVKPSYIQYEELVILTTYYPLSIFPSVIR